MDEVTRFGGVSSTAAAFNNNDSWKTAHTTFPSTDSQMDPITADTLRQRGERATTTVQVDVDQVESPATPSLYQASHPPRLLFFNELPAWHQDNHHIISSYRPITQSLPHSLSSLLYLHNETLNIYTHLLPSLLFFSLQFLTNQYFNTHYPRSSKWDRLAFALFFFSAGICMGLSAMYHTLMCHSKGVSEVMLRMDFVGIVVLILGKFVSGIYVGFYCEPFLRNVYFTMILSLGSATMMVLMSPKYQGPRYRSFRLATFISTGLSAFLPLLHSIHLFGWSQNWMQSGMPYYLLEGLLLTIGSIFYSMRIPECYRPGRFDVFGASHQVFHVLVVGAAVVHLWGIMKAYDYAYHHRVCGLA